MKKTAILLSLIMSYFLISCTETKKTAEQEKLELRTEEISNPLTYLSLESISVNKNKIEDTTSASDGKYEGNRVSGIVRNSASIAKFKELKLVVRSMSADQRVLEETPYVMYEIYEPNSTKELLFKINDLPEGTDKVDVVITGATVED